MKTASETAFESWMNGLQGKLSPEEFTAFKNTFGSKADAQQYVASTVMMRADYGNQTLAQKRDFETKMAALESEATRLTEYDKQLSDWESYVRTNNISVEQYNQAAAEVAQLRAYRDQTQAKIEQLGLNELIADLEVDGSTSTQTQTADQGRQPVNNQNQPFNQPPTAPFATQTQLQAKINEAALSTVAGVATLMKLNSEYRSLTGNELPNPDELVIEAVQAQRPVMDYIAEKFEFAKLRSDRAAAQMESEIQRRVVEQVAKAVSQHQTPIPGGMGQSPIMSQTIAAMNAADTASRQQIPLFAKPGQPGRGANAATEAYLSGKYRNQNFNPHTGG